MRALVTGGAGFIGSHLVEALAEEGSPVVVLDDLSTGRTENLEAVASAVELVVGSVLDQDLVDRLVGSVDVVFHLAAAVGVELVLRDPEGGLWTNVVGTRNVADSAVRRGRRLVFVSSSEVYGQSSDLPLREAGDRVLGPVGDPRWSYAEGKALGELLVELRAGAGGLEAVTARLFNTVGRRQRGDHGMVLPRFVSQAMAGRPITVYGDGTQTRCFCPVEDVVGALMALMASVEATGATVNLGSEREVSILELAELVREVVGSSSPIQLVSPEDPRRREAGDAARRVPDISRARSLIDFEPMTDLTPVIRSLAAERAGV